MAWQALPGTHSKTEGVPVKGNGAAEHFTTGEDGVNNPRAAAGGIDEIENAAQDQATDGADPAYDDDDTIPFDRKPDNKTFLEMLGEVQSQAQLYSNQVNRQAWERAYKAFHQEHFTGSKYTTKDFLNRSKLFIPKTRTAIRKDLASVSASLFGSIDAVNCMAGNEGDKEQRASAAIIQELVNYRTDRSSGKASIPWFHVAMGARQTSLLTGICLSKQYWKLDLRRAGEEDVPGEDGRKRDVWVPDIDRPDSVLFPSENFIIDPAADWTNPAQDSAYLVLKWPMRMDEIRRKQHDPRMPWNKVAESVLKAAGDRAKMDMAAIRRARERGIDRFDESQTGYEFDVIWVFETFMRTAGEDWTFISVDDQALLTDPKPVREVYPEQFGERPVVMGYGAFEAFSIFPQSSAESWQPLQQESNDLRNLTMDAIKQNVMPVTKVRRGRQIDLDQLKRRGQGTAIMVNDKDDVTWEKAPDVSAGTQILKQQLDIEFDDLAGQANYGTVQDNNALGKTLGGLKLAAGAANAVQEFDIRIWIETWCEPVLMQLVRLEQYYESDPIILGLCGERAKLIQKYGVNEITDELLENNVTIRVNIGLGAGDPQQRLAKFNSATQVALPLLQLDPKFQSGELTIDSEAVMSEVYGAAGYRDGGRRFVKAGQPKQNPMAGLEEDKVKSEAEKNRAQAKKAIIDAVVAVAEVGLSQRAQLEGAVSQQIDNHFRHMDQVGKAADMGFDHAERVRQQQNVAKGLAPDGSPIDTPEEAAAADKIKQEMGAGGEAPAADPTADPAAMPAAAPDDPAAPPMAPQQQAAPRKRTVNITKRGPDGRASAFEVVD